MKYSREELEAMSDDELTFLVIEKSGKDFRIDSVGNISVRLYPESKSFDGVYDIFRINNPNDMMPLVFEAGISLEYLGPEYEAYSLDDYDEADRQPANHVTHENPLRATAIVYILVKQDS